MIVNVIQYITEAPYFWFGFGMTIASGMFVGATIYNGELDLLRKGLWTMAFYVLFLLIINAARVVDTLMRDGLARPEMAWAATNTIIITTFAYVVGMILGVWVTRYAHGRIK